MKKQNLTLNEVRSRLYPLITIFPDSGKIKLIKEDPADNLFLNCAVVSNASFIISGDKHLLKLKKIQDIPIIKIRDFLEKFQ